MILFRADGNQNVGSGHVMRCLSLADAFRRKGIDSLFVMAENDLQGVVESRGHEVNCLNRSYLETEDEISLFAELISKRKPSLIITDGYYFSENYFEEIKRLGVPVWYVDDYGTHAYDVDGILNYNVYGIFLDYKSLYERAGKKLPRLLLGTSYAPLREEYRNVPKRSLSKKCKNILVSTGGTDPLHVTKRMTEYLLENHVSKELFFHFLLTDLNRDKEELLKLEGRSGQIVFHAGLTCLKDIILASDVAFAASGSTLYELCACGLPTINYALADNQLPGCDAFKKLGLMESCGDLRGRDDVVPFVFDTIFNMASDYPKRQAYSRKMQELVDGFGADRASEIMISEEIN